MCHLLKQYVVATVNSWFLLLVVAMFALSSCTPSKLAKTVDAMTDTTRLPRQSTDSDGDATISIDDLQAQLLRSGQCGLFLFTPFPSPRFVFFAESSTNSAKMVINGRETALRLVTTDGTLMEQHYTKSVFTASDETAVRVTIDDFERTDRGIRVETGLINVTDEGGWNVTIPVSGTTACYDQDS